MDIGLISVIMAAYNAEKTIRSAIASVLGQTYRDLELIVVNDASADRTRDIVLEIAGTDPRVKLIDKAKNGGVSLARKCAAEAASGEWIAVLDSDDLWEPNKLEAQAKLQRRTNAELMYTGSAFIDEDGNRSDYVLEVPETLDFRMLLRQNLISNSSALVRKQLYLEHYASGDGMHEDFALWLSILKTGIRAYGINEPLLIYRLSAGSKSANKLKAAVMNWRTYRYIGLDPLSSAYYETRYALNGIIKYSSIKGRAKNCSTIERH